VAYGENRFQGIPDNIEPGLDDRQLTRLLGLDLQDASATFNIEPEAPVQEKTRSKNASVVNLTEEEVSLVCHSLPKCIEKNINANIN
jgi:hypothetical protein